VRSRLPNFIEIGQVVSPPDQVEENCGADKHPDRTAENNAALLLTVPAINVAALLVA